MSVSSFWPDASVGAAGPSLTYDDVDAGADGGWTCADASNAPIVHSVAMATNLHPCAFTRRFNATLLLRGETSWVSLPLLGGNASLANSKLSNTELNQQ